MNKCRVAAVQFVSGTDLNQNLETCLRMIDCAIGEGAQLIVLPEFCNHLSWYDDHNHAWRVALAEDGSFLQAIAEKARDNLCHIVINVSLRRPPTLEQPQPITVTSILLGPGGEQVMQANKQTMMGHENDYFVRADRITPVVDTVVGKLGLFPCRDGVTCETPRSLALRGAEILCDSLNSFALDEARLHVPARATENKVFLVAANKIGPLIPEPLIVPVSEATHIPVEFLMGAGESQIVAPDGRVLAKGPRAEEAIVVADINLDEAHNKLRPDGSSQFLNRRPSLYGPLAEAPQGEYCVGGADAVRAALYSPSQQSAAALTEVVHLIRDLDKELALLVLPELFCFGGVVGPDAVHFSAEVINDIATACELNPQLVVATSLVLQHAGSVTHCALLLNHQGMIFCQPQLHATERHCWSALGDNLQTFQLLWGKVAVLTADDVAYPELVKVAALQGVHALIAPIQIQELWETQYGLPSRAAENRICVLASSSELADGIGTGMIATLESEFTMMTPWRQRQFDGIINSALITSQRPGLTLATFHPHCASNKLISANTDLLQGRPWPLCAELVAAEPLACQRSGS